MTNGLSYIPSLCINRCRRDRTLELSVVETRLPVELNLTESNNYGIMYKISTHKEVYFG